MRLVSPLVAALLLALAPPSADACSGPACEARLRLSGDGRVPASAPALAVQPTTFGPGEYGAVTLTRPDGGTVAAAAVRQDAELVLTPQEPLAPGTYALSVQASCGDAPVTSQLQVEVLPTSPLPQGLGSFSLADSGAATLAFPSGGPCRERLPGAFARFAWTPPPELVPYLGTTRWTLQVDGKPWARTRYGGLRADGTETAFAEAGLVRTAYTNWPLLQVQALCDTAAAAERGLAEGAHTAVLVAELAGGPTWTSAPVEFQLQCRPGDDDTDGGETGACSTSPAGLAAGLLALLAPALLRRARYPARRRK